MRVLRPISLIVAMLLVGCRANPANLAMMVVGDAISDSDVKGRESRLIGQRLTAADSMFGARLETLIV